MNLDIDLDPDCNFFDYQNNSCCDFTEKQFNSFGNSGQEFSVINLNSRSLHTNEQNITEYQNKFSKKCKVIAMSETELEMDFQLEGYKFNFQNEMYKRGGGVPLYVHNCLRYKLVESLH